MYKFSFDIPIWMSRNPGGGLQVAGTGSDRNKGCSSLSCADDLSASFSFVDITPGETLVFRGSNAIFTFKCRSNLQFAIQKVTKERIRISESSEISVDMRALDWEMRADYLPRQVPSTTSYSTMTYSESVGNYLTRLCDM